MTGDTGRHTAAAQGRAEAARRYGTVPVPVTDPNAGPVHGFGDAPLGSAKWRTQQRLREARSWGQP